MTAPFTAADLLPRLALPDGAAPGQLLVAYSGGTDSTVLLHALATLRDAGRLAGHRLEALHVHHGLHEAADRWAAFCRDQATRLAVPLAERRLGLAVREGESEEAVARDARYAVLLAGLEPGGRLLTAHHADDQLETVLLALARGAGPAGLAAMPAVMARGRGWHLRPLLDVPRAALAAYAVQHGLTGIEDPANRDPRFARAYLREAVLPALYQRWPGIAASAARSARLCATADALNTQLARADLALGPGEAPGPRLAAGALATLDDARCLNALRYWIRANGHPSPPERRLRSAVNELVRSPAGGEACVRWQGTELRAYRRRLYLTAPLPTAGGDGRPMKVLRSLALPRGLGEVVLEPARGGDAPARRLSVRALAGSELTVGFRRGGERIRLPGRQGTRQLKHLLQAWGVVPWMRQRVPLLHVNGELAAVADLAVAAPFAAAPGEPALVLHWRAGPPIF